MKYPADIARAQARGVGLTAPRPTVPPYSGLGDPFSSIVSGIANAVSSIGKGRKQADIVTAIQDQTINYLYSFVSGEIFRGMDAATANRLYSDIAAVENQWRGLYNKVNDPRVTPTIDMLLVNNRLGAGYPPTFSQARQALAEYIASLTARPGTPPPVVIARPPSPPSLPPPIVAPIVTPIVYNPANPSTAAPAPSVIDNLRDIVTGLFPAAAAPIQSALGPPVWTQRPVQRPQAAASTASALFPLAIAGGVLWLLFKNR